MPPGRPNAIPRLVLYCKCVRYTPNTKRTAACSHELQHDCQAVDTSSPAGKYGLVIQEPDFSASFVGGAALQAAFLQFCDGGSSLEALLVLLLVPPTLDEEGLSTSQ